MLKKKVPKIRKNIGCLCYTLFLFQNSFLFSNLSRSLQFGQAFFDPLSSLWRHTHENSSRNQQTTI
jgi:hypothetical protein